MQAHGPDDDDFTPSDNQFSAESYRIIHFVVDMPVRLPRRILDRAPARRGAARATSSSSSASSRSSTATPRPHNELGEASHAKYKERQKKAVMRRLQLGGSGEAGPASPEKGPAPVAQDVRKKK